MAFNDRECEAYFQGEIRPIIFEVYTESGIPFRLMSETAPGVADVPKFLPDAEAWCVLMDEEGHELERLRVTLIEVQPARKVMVTSWNTGRHQVGYFRLQVWVLVNISGMVDEQGGLVVEGKLASEEILRYIKV
jgi:hypothetical protein